MIIDISQEVFSCKVFPGDPQPVREVKLSISDGAVCNLTAFSMCAHNGTHVDAPYHFINDGKTIDSVSLDSFVGDCCVVKRSGEIHAEDAEDILCEAKGVGAAERILLAGKLTVCADAAEVFAAAGVKLLGNESQTVGPEEAPMEVHLILLGAGVVLLEGIVLDGVEEGRYTLCAAPLNLGGADGSPCRAILMR